MIEANVSCGSNTGKRPVVVDPLGSCSGTSAQHTGGAVTDFKSFRIKSRLVFFGMDPRLPALAMSATP